MEEKKMAGHEYAAQRVIEEVSKTVVGKQDILMKIMTAILAGGHILIEDIPGTGKTTMALAFSKAMSLKERRVQFTPDVLPADLTGFNIYQKETGKFVYQPGAVMCNLLLADEINRTSPKTQSALLEVMEEQQVTVDGITRKTGRPFIVIATENPTGSAGTQLLPESQLDRFMICVSMGYPTLEEEMEIIRRGREKDRTAGICPILDGSALLEMMQEAKDIFMHERICRYIAQLAKATRENPWLELGLSPRGTVALSAMAKAWAYLKGRQYVTPSDVENVFPCVASHRLVLNMKAKVGHVRVEEVIRQILENTEKPALKTRR